MARAVQLDAVRLEDNSWLVTGGALPHVLSADGRECGCLDFQLHNRGDGYRCKHLVRVGLIEGRAEDWAALRELVAKPKRASRKATP
jgi:hypothetical protein